jgi:hypothetical protein
MKKAITSIYIIAIILTMISFTSCEKEVFGCTDPSSTNYDPSATDDNGTCEYNGNVTFWYNSVGTDATVTVGGQTFFITHFTLINIGISIRYGDIFSKMLLQKFI